MIEDVKELEIRVSELENMLEELRDRIYQLDGEES